MDDVAAIAAWVRDRDDAAFACLVEHHVALVTGVCQRGLDGAAVDEAVQAVFIILARKAGGIADPKRLGSWLHGVAIRVCRKSRRAAARRALHEQRAASLHQAESQSSPMTTWTELRPHLDEAIATLNASQREAVVGHFLEGLTQSAVAARLGISEDAAHQRIHYALGKLRTWFGKRGLALSVSALAVGLSSESAAAEPAAVAACTQAALHPAAASGASALAKGVMAAGAMQAVVASLWVAIMAAAGGVAAWQLATGSHDIAPAVLPTHDAVRPAAAPPAAAAGLAQRYIDDAGIERDPAVLFADNFEAGDFSRWDDLDGNPAPDNQIVSDPALVHAGHRAAQLLLSSGGRTVDLVKWLPQGHDRIYARWYYRFATDYGPDGGAVSAPGAHINGGGLIATRDRSLLGTGHLAPDGANYFSCQLWANMVLGRSPAPGFLMLRAQHPGMPRETSDATADPWWGELYVPDRQLLPECGRWHCMELLMAANAPGHADGQLAFWLDGVEGQRIDTLILRDRADLGINGFWLPFAMRNCPRPTSVCIDDVVIATTYVGPMRRR